MMPARPWASVSWISRAIRCRSALTPASRACVSSCACSPAFSVSVSSSLRFASASSSIICLRFRFCSSPFSPIRPKPMYSADWNAASTRTTTARPALSGWNPPVWLMAMNTVGTKTPA